MATRFYLTSDFPVWGLTPTPSASWTVSSSPYRSALVRTRKGSVFTTRSKAETSGSTADVLICQLISDQLAAQTVSGKVKGVIRAQESALAADMRAQMTIRVLSSNGSTVRGTLLAFDTSALSHEFSDSDLYNRSFPLQALDLGGETLTPVAASRGDRLVVEVGYRAHNASATSYTGSLAMGDSSTSDLAENETDRDVFNPWIEFNSDLVFASIDDGAVDRKPDSDERKFADGVSEQGESLLRGIGPGDLAIEAGGGGGPTITTYYRMRVRDDGSGPPPVYRVWTTTNPYSSPPPPPPVGTWVDRAILKSWTA